MKKQFIFLIPIVFLFSITCSVIDQKCSLNQNVVNQQILEKQVISCFKKALQKNWLNVIDYLIKERKAQYQEDFIKILEMQIKRLQILQEQVVLGTSDTQPILKWGQNKTHLFISFKLSHRWDSPPCLLTQSEETLLNQAHFYYNNICLVSHQRINFKIDFNLFKNVIPNISNQTNFNETFQQYKFQVKKDGVGTYSTILLKQIPEIWLFLTNKNKIYPIWYQIAARYPQDNNDYQMKIQRFRQIKEKTSVNSSSQSQL